MIEDRKIPGITGDAFDSEEGTTGPVLLQDDHDQFSFRNKIFVPVIKP